MKKEARSETSADKRTPGEITHRRSGPSQYSDISDTEHDAIALEKDARCSPAFKLENDVIFVLLHDASGDAAPARENQDLGMQ